MSSRRPPLEHPESDEKQDNEMTMTSQNGPGKPISGEFPSPCHTQLGPSVKAMRPARSTDMTSSYIGAESDLF